MKMTARFAAARRNSERTSVSSTCISKFPSIQTDVIESRQACGQKVVSFLPVPLHRRERSHTKHYPFRAVVIIARDPPTLYCPPFGCQSGQRRRLISVAVATLRELHIQTHTNTCIDSDWLITYEKLRNKYAHILQ